jgi:hypothetical protein
VEALRWLKDKKWPVISYMSLLALSVITFVIVGERMFSVILPPGDDPGNWLKRIHAIAGVTLPLWDETPWSYPPLFFFLSYLTAFIVGDSLLAMKLVATVIFSLIPISMYLFAYQVSGSYLVSVSAAAMSAFWPSNYEMIWWGGYPNLLALVVMPLMLAATLKAKSNKTWTYVALSLGITLILSHHLTALVCAGVLWLTTILDSIANRTVDDSLLRVSAAYTLCAALYWTAIVPSYAIAGAVFQPIESLVSVLFLFVFKDLIVLSLALAASAVGAFALLRKGRRLDFLMVASWVVTPAMFLVAFGTLGVKTDAIRLAVFLVFPMAVLIGMVLGMAREALGWRSVKEGGDSVVEVTIVVEKAVAVLLSAILLGNVVSLGVATNESSFDYFVFIRRGCSEQDLLSALSWIGANTPATAVIASEHSIGRWIEGYSSRRVLYVLPSSQALLRNEYDRAVGADTVLNSNYRMANEYIKLDECESILSSLAPSISVFSGLEYKPVVYVDDAFVRVNFTRDAKSWVEAPFGAWLYRSVWLERSSSAAALGVEFMTQSLRINKTLELASGNRTAYVTYHIVPKEGATLNSVSLSVWLSWGAVLNDYHINERGVNITAGYSELDVFFEQQPTHLEFGRDPEFGQFRLLATFDVNETDYSLTAGFRAPKSPSSWVKGVETMSAKEAISKFNITNLVLSKDSPLVSALAATHERPSGEVVYVDDAFVRVHFTKAGQDWVEAPCNGMVLDEKDIDQDGRRVSHTTFETVALLINRTLIVRDNVVELQYIVSAKPGSEVHSIELPLWIAWERWVTDAVVSGQQVLLVSNAGSIQITASGSNVVSSYGIDREFGVPRVLILGEALNGSVSICVKIESVNDGTSLGAEIERTTRPQMQGADKIRIATHSPTLYRVVFQAGSIVVLSIEKSGRE